GGAPARPPWRLHRTQRARLSAHGLLSRPRGLPPRRRPHDVPVRAPLALARRRAHRARARPRRADLTPRGPARRSELLVALAADRPDPRLRDETVSGVAVRGMRGVAAHAVEPPRLLLRDRVAGGGAASPHL